MPLFKHHHAATTPAGPGFTVAGLAGLAAAQGWAAAGKRPFDGHLEDAVAEINRAMHSAAPSLGAVRLRGIRVGVAVFSDEAGGR